MERADIFRNDGGLNMDNDKSMIETLKSINETLKCISQTLLMMCEYLSEDEYTKEERRRKKNHEEGRRRVNELINQKNGRFPVV